jgi:type II secretory pathway pseudopilin PulG
MAVPRMRRSGGFTYLSLIILVAIIALVSASALKLGSVIQRSRAEMELLDIGAAFSDALQSYADATPAGQSPQPRTLKDLLRDPRFPYVRRHLRKIFVDPMTGRDEWGIVYVGDKTGVLAVYSLSDAKPVKIGNFPLRFQTLAGLNKISEWRFAMTNPSTSATPGAAAAPSSQPTSLFPPSAAPPIAPAVPTTPADTEQAPAAEPPAEPPTEPAPEISTTPAEPKEPPPEPQKEEK